MFQNRSFLLAARMLIAVSTSSLVMPSIAAEAQHANLSGAWEFSWIQFANTNVDRIQLGVSGDKIIGKAPRNLGLEGTFKGDKLELKLLDPEKKIVATINGTLRNDRLSGVMKLNESEYNWSARRPASRNLLCNATLFAAAGLLATWARTRSAAAASNSPSAYAINSSSPGTSLIISLDRKSVV